jgi:hypothetical protein
LPPVHFEEGGRISLKHAERMTSATSVVADAVPSMPGLYLIENESQIRRLASDRGSVRSVWRNRNTTQGSAI